MQSRKPKTALAAEGFSDGSVSVRPRPQLGQLPALELQRPSVPAAVCAGSAWLSTSPVFGDTWREISADVKADDAEGRRSSLVEGLIYPAGTIPGDGFRPTADGSIGRWFCWCWTIFGSDRPEPHLIDTHSYIMGTMSQEQQFPEDTFEQPGPAGDVRRQPTCVSRDQRRHGNLHRSERAGHPDEQRHKHNGARRDGDSGAELGVRLRSSSAGLAVRPKNAVPPGLWSGVGSIDLAGVMVPR